MRRVVGRYLKECEKEEHVQNEEVEKVCVKRYIYSAIH